MRSEPRVAVRLGALALFLVAASCAVFRAVMPSAGPAPRAFNHEAHTVRGIGCADCHDGGEKDAHAGMPSKEFCMMCHEELDKDPQKGIEKKVAWFLDPEGKPSWSAFTKQPSEIRFTHGPHAKAKVACTECHTGIDKDTGLLPGMLQRMASCTACHAEKAPQKTACATCHQTIDRVTPPPNHRMAWTKLHGECSREGRVASTANECSMCHTKDSCVTCHQTRPPSDHTEFWRVRAHGVAAAIDRSRCQTCHTTDSCVRCHQQTAPVSHGAGWNAPRDAHCQSCHVPLARTESCSVCHRTTPGHDLAPPKPVWHNAGMICRSCHAATMKHPDNGDNCNACHR